MLLKKLWTYSQVIEQFFLHYHFKEHLRIQLYVASTFFFIFYFILFFLLVGG